jgi:hypothetical protein
VGKQISTQARATLPNWLNNHQYTVSLGGPIIKNKTVFIACGTNSSTTSAISSQRA